MRGFFVFRNLVPSEIPTEPKTGENCSCREQEPQQTTVLDV
jgi:hypothetical protein